jgi:hypothetical protein
MGIDKARKQEGQGWVFTLYDMLNSADRIREMKPCLENIPVGYIHIIGGNTIHIKN